MTSLQRVFADNALWVWFLSLGILGATFALLKVTTWALRRRLLAREKRSPSELIRLAADLVRRTHTLFLLAVSLFAASLALNLPPAASRGVGVLAVIALLIQSATWGNRLITYWVNREIKQKLEAERDAATATTLNAVAFLGKIALWTVVLLLALDNVGINVTALITGLGIAGIAVALALQSILGDLFASIAIVVDKPFLVGDFIVVGSHMGTVERIGLKTTRIRSLSGEQLVFSNSELLRSAVQNYKRMTERRVAFTFRLPFSTPHDKLTAVPAIVREAVESQPHTRFGWALITAYGEYGLQYEVVYHVLVPDFTTYRQVHSAIHVELLRRLGEVGIQLAYPTQVVGIRTDDEPPLGGTGRTSITPRNGG